MIVLYCLLGEYLLFINIDGFVMMAVDKSRARRGGRRVSEAALFFIAFLGGSPGIMLAMYTLRHKTRHTSFTVGMPPICFFEAVLIAAALIYAASA